MKMSARTKSVLWFLLDLAAILSAWYGIFHLVDHHTALAIWLGIAAYDIAVRKVRL